MRWLVWWVRSCFCSHTWEREERTRVVESEFSTEIIKKGVVVSATCSKCGWHRSYWKFQ